jgi:xylulokinase
MALVGIDVGGTGVKAAAYTHDGRLLSQAYREYTMLNPRPGVYTFSPHAMHEAADAVLREVISGCGEEVLAIGCSSFGESFICYDGDGNILCDSIMYFDARGDEDVRLFNERWSGEALERYGIAPPGRINSIIKMRVMSGEDPGFFAKVKRIRLLPDFILSYYGAEHVCDDSIAATTRCYDRSAINWVSEMLEWVGVAPEAMPSVAPIGSAIGSVPPGIAREIGVKPGARLVSCGHDHTAASLGAGLYRAGQMMNEIGTVDVLMMLIGENDLPKADAANGGAAGLRVHPASGCYMIGGAGSLTGGAVLKWFRDHLGLHEKHLYSEAGLGSFYDEYGKGIPREPTDIIVLPQFATGAPGRGQAGSIINMTMATTNVQIYRAFMEGETYAAYANFKRIDGDIRRVDSVIALGGGARSPEYMRIRSDIFNVPVRTVASDQAGTHGGAMLAGVAVGVWGSIKEAIQASVRVKDTFEPNPQNHEYYMGMYEKYLRVYEAVNSAMYPGG